MREEENHGRREARKRKSLCLAAAALLLAAVLAGGLIRSEYGRSAEHPRYGEDGKHQTLAAGRIGDGAQAAASRGPAETAAVLEQETAAARPEPAESDPVILTTAESLTAENMTAEAETAGETAEPEESDAESEESGDITLLFAGDVYFSDHVMNAYDRAGGIGGVLDEEIRAEIEAADIFMVNQEFPFTDRGTAAADKQFTFRIPPEKVSLFREMGVDIVTMANNHILDFGPEGITDSLAALDGAGILHVGAGEDLEQAKKLEVLEVKGRRIGFLGTSRVYMAASWAAGAGHSGVFSTYDPTLPLEEIRAAREQCDYLVVYVHWGIERNTKPENYQRNMGRQYIDAGADLVVGSHPHVLQEIEYYDGKPIVYSLGNFVFGSSIPETELLKVVLKAPEDPGSASASGNAERSGDSSGTDGDSASRGRPDLTVEVTTIPCTSSGGYTRVRGQ